MTLTLHRDTDLHRQLLASEFWRQSGESPRIHKVAMETRTCVCTRLWKSAPSWSGMVLTEKTCLRERQMCAR